ncbi:MAG: hypothetical protein ACRD88_05340, partial [Terriglobia bacterium]
LSMTSASHLAAQFGNDALVSDRSAIRVGAVAPSWIIRNWINSGALDIGQLQGKVILVRFFSDSPLSAATLNEFYRTYRDQGLVVVGFYTPQPMPGEIDVDEVRRLVVAMGFEFPVGVDARWETVNRYWLTEADADMGAAAFLIDRKGVIRFIQGRGLYEKGSPNRAVRREYETMQRLIEQLLKESVPASEPPTAPPGPRQ